MCLWACVGGWRTSVWPHTTINHTTGVSCVVASVTTFASGVMTFTHSARAAFPALVRILAGERTESLQRPSPIIWWLTETSLDFCAHLIALDRTFPVEPSHVRQTIAAAAAAPHGGHVVVKERAVVCSHRDRLQNAVGTIHPQSSHTHVTMEECVSDLCCCCSAHPARWWVRSHRGSRYCRSVHQSRGTSCTPAVRWALWEEISGISKRLFYMVNNL